MARSAIPLVAALGLLGGGVLVGDHAAAQQAGLTTAPIPSASSLPTVPATGSGAERMTDDASLEKVSLDKCREQKPQEFLVRGNWYPKTKDADELKKAREWMEASLKYRTEKYGHFEGFGRADWNPHPPKFYAVKTTFAGLPLLVNKRIVPALKCVEAALKKGGLLDAYKPQGYSGIRFKNTYRGAEISNHIFGIAVDIDPSLNTCCNCLRPWSDHPLCKKKKDVWERMAMPKSWVDTFERYGFYWLGHDVIQDTMHFEFLGDPDLVLSP